MSWCLWAVGADVLWAILSECLVSNPVACGDGSVIYRLCSPCYDHWAEHNTAIIQCIFQSIASCLGWWPVFRVGMTCWLHYYGCICKILARIGSNTLSVKLYLVDRHGSCLSGTSLFLRIPLMACHDLPIRLLVCFPGLSGLFSQLTLAYLIGVTVLIFFFSNMGPMILWTQLFLCTSGSHELILWTAYSQGMQVQDESFHNYWVLRRRCAQTSSCFWQACCRHDSVLKKAKFLMLEAFARIVYWKRLGIVPYQSFLHVAYCGRLGALC
jgi:hypothetical protein